MNFTATIANSLWGATNLPLYLRFRRALAEPEAAQRLVLQDYVQRNAQTVFGRHYGFDSIRGYDDFAKRVPPMDYVDLERWIERIRRGEPNLLTSEPVVRLVPTSGSSGARKLIPFTPGLNREFNAAIGPWLVDLLRQHPRIAGGPAYWSVTPVSAPTTEESAVPIGFDDDTAYLGGTRQKFARAVMAVPDEMRHLRLMEDFRYVTLLCLLRQKDLRLISVWHPSFLTLLLEALPAMWRELLTDIRSGQCERADVFPPRVRAALNPGPLARRAAELNALDSRKPESLWPCLELISCWGDGAAEFAASGLKEFFPNTVIQSKGLLATEGCVTIPFAGQRPVAVRSHFYEFIDDAGAVHPVQDLQAGQSYEVLLTTAGGLWRYRLGDSVQVSGFVGETPSLRFLGRSGNISDLCGEKLTEAFVTQTIQSLLANLNTKPVFVLLAPDTDRLGHRYTLYVEGNASPHFAERIDQSLRQNPNYAYCRDLGQLLPIRLFIITERGYEKFASRQTARGACLGGIKPASFSRMGGWSQIFAGAYDSDRLTCAPALEVMQQA